MSEYRLIYCSCPDTESAAIIARQLVAEKLAACVSIVPGMRSIYQWKGQIEEESEVLLLIKSHADRLDALETTIVQYHPYELPEIIAVPIETGLSAYLHWIDEALERPLEQKE